MRNDSNTKLRLDELLYGASGTGIPIYDPFSNPYQINNEVEYFIICNTTVLKLQ